MQFLVLEIIFYAQVLDTWSGQCKVAKLTVFVLTPFKAQTLPSIFCQEGRDLYQLIHVEVIVTKMNLISLGCIEGGI